MICLRISQALGKRLGDVSLVIALDSGCGDYQRMWTTTSLRGVVGRHARRFRF